MAAIFIMNTHEYWMKLALKEAEKALMENEIPIGAVLVKNDVLIMSAHNRTRQLNNSLAHAEKLMIDEIVASQKKFLNDYSLYVTIEPCLMCAGMIIWARIGKLIFGAYDQKAGAVGSVYNVLLDKSFNHHPKIISGVCEDQAKLLIQNFFQQRRKRRVAGVVERDGLENRCGFTSTQGSNP